jgi:hypothetical protein
MQKVWNAQGITNMKMSNAKMYAMHTYIYSKRFLLVRNDQDITVTQISNANMHTYTYIRTRIRAHSRIEEATSLLLATTSRTYA